MAQAGIALGAEGASAGPGSGISPWRRFKADPAEWFSAEEIEKATAYSTPSRRLARTARAVAFAAEVLVVVTHLAPNVLDALDVSNWVVGVFVVLALTSVVDIVVAVPFAAYRELVFDKKWGFSTQTTKGFVSDQVKGLLLGAVIMTLLFVPIWAAIRATDSWWVWGWLLLTALQVGMLAVYPVLIAPIFNKFKPLEDEDLKAELLAMAKDADVPVKDVLVSDGSRRDTRENAYFAGLGRTRQLVLFDTILKRPREQLRSVVAHELGHWKLRHLVVSLPLAIVTTFAAFWVLQRVLAWDSLLELAGVDDLRTPGAIPLFTLVFGLITRVPGFATTALTRVHEREADLFSLDTTRDPDAFVAAMRALYVDNGANLTPTWWQRFTRTHPFADERMALGTEWARRQGIALSAAEPVEPS
ncbi:MAG TPA: M48 family metallopeptidase [Acidimicrobiales bacterium]